MGFGAKVRADFRQGPGKPLLQPLFPLGPVLLQAKLYKSKFCQDFVLLSIFNQQILL